MKNLSLLACFLLASQISAQTTDGLVAWFPFNGNAFDESPNGHHGQAIGATLTEDRFGNPNAAYFFDGVDDFIIVPDAPDLRLGATSFTISLWVRPFEINDLQSHSILSKRASSGNQGYLFQLIGTEHVMDLAKGAFNIITSGGWDDPLLTTEQTLFAGDWHHVAYCFDKTNNTGQFYFDNQPDVSGAMVPCNPGTSSSLYIGKDKLTDGIEYPTIQAGYFGGFHFFGAIDDIRIYNRKLSDGERAELFQEGTSPVANPVLSSSIRIMPDPVSDFLKIEAENVDIHSFAIHDTSGKLILENSFTPLVDCQFLRQGTYLISFFGKTHLPLQTQKFIKM